MNLFEIHEKMTRHLFSPYLKDDERFLALAICGEAGELANLIKKLWRDGDAMTHEKKMAMREDVREEIADVRIYLELLAKCYGIEGSKLDEAVLKKLEKVVARRRGG